jgi:hypothetical protein
VSVAAENYRHRRLFLILLVLWLLSELTAELVRQGHRYRECTRPEQIISAVTVQQTGRPPQPSPWPSCLKR